MNGSVVRRARARWIAVLTALMVFAGAGAAAAYWTAQVQVRDTASAATPGLEQKLLPEGQPSLSTIYSVEEPTAAGLLSVTNTGTREADYTLTVSAESDSDLASAIQVAAAPVGIDGECTPQTALDNAQRGDLSAPFTFHGTSLIEADESIAVCIQTSLAAEDVAAFAEDEVELQVSSALIYAKGEEWKREAPAESVVQSVEPDASSGVEEMTCGGFPPDYLELAFSQPSDGLKGRVEYRVFLAHEDTPDTPFEFEARDLSGYYTKVQVPHNSHDLLEFARSQYGGLGNTWVHVEQKIDGEQTWTPIAFYQMHISEAAPEEAGELRMHCGWQ